MVERTVVELIIDATGAERGSAAYVVAMDAAMKAARRTVDYVSAAVTQGNTTMAASATSVASRVNAWNRLAGAVDPVIKAINSYNQAELNSAKVTENAVRSGLRSREEASRLHIAVMQKEALALKQVRASMAETEATYARNYQAAINARLGVANVRNPVGPASRGDDIEAALNRGEATRRIVLESNNPRLSAINQYRTQIAEWREEQKRGVISADELTAAITRQRSAALDNLRVIRQGGPNRQGTSASRLARQSNFNSLNIASQFQDIGITAAMGQNPLTIALQQGTQISAVLESMGGARSGISALRAALVSIISPMSLITIGAVAGAAAFVQWAISGKDNVNKIKDAMDDLTKAQRAYNDASKQSLGDPSAYSGRGALSYQRDLEVASQAANKALKEQVETLKSSASTKIDTEVLKRLGAVPGEVNPGDAALEFNAVDKAILDLSNTLDVGRGGLIKLDNILAEIAKSTDAFSTVEREAADATRALIKPSVELEQTLIEAAKAKDALTAAFRRGERGTASGPLDGGYAQTQAAEMRRMNAAFAAESLSITARSPEERAAAAGAQAAAVHQDESLSVRELRIGNAERRARAEAEYAISAAQKDRLRALDATLASQRLEQSLIGKTAGEVASLRMEHEKLAALKEESFRTGTTASEKEIEAIKEAARQTGILADETARLTLQKNLQFEQEQTARTADQRDTASQLRGAGLPVDLNSDAARSIDSNREMRARVDMSRELRFEQEQLMRTANDQAVATRLRSAGLEVDLNSFDARQIKFNQWLGELQSTTSTFLGDFKSGFISDIQNGDNFGKVLSKALGNAILNAFNRAAENGIDLLSKMISAAIGGAFGFRGGGNGGAASSLASGFVSGTTLDALIGSNDNISAPARSSIVDLATRSAGPSAMASYRDAIAYVESRGSGDYNALGPLTKGDRAYGRYQVMGNNVAPWTKAALGKSMTPEQFLKNPSAQDSVFDHRFGGYVDKYGPSGAAQAWFGGPGSVGRGGAGADILGTTGTGYVNKFNSALEKVSGSATTASNSLVGFGGGLGSLAQSLSSVGGGAGGGGWFSGLISKFGSASGALNSMMRISPWATNIIAAGGGGLFAEGTAYAPGGRSMVNERGGEIIDLPRGSRVIPHDVSMKMAERAASNSSSGQQKIELHTHIHGGSGDDHIRKLVDEGNAKALGRYHDNQRRGGQKQMQQSYAKLR